MTENQMNLMIDESGPDNELDRISRWCAAFLIEKGRPAGYHIQTFGCQQNDHDSEIASGLLESLGFVREPVIERADLILFNTCSVRANADDRLFGHLGRLKPAKKEKFPLIGVFGCMMEQEVHRDAIRKTFTYVDFLLGAGAMELMPLALDRLLREESPSRTLDLTGQDKDPFATDLPVKRQRPHRALVTIMTGCNNFCSYCIVPFTRGREKSRPYEAVMEEARRAVEQGASEIMLLGQNVNSYGHDIRRQGGEAVPFAALLRDVSRIDSLGIVRYMTSHPKDLSDDLIEVIAGCPVVEPHIHLPVQSGSDRILQRMNRRYTASHYLELVGRLRAARPEMTITTDLIVGFPDETEEDFEATLRLMEQARFDAAFTFIYSPRAGTPAASLYHESSQPLVQERFQRLVDLQNRLSLESNQRLVGQRVEVLVDGPSRRDPAILSGRTRDDRLVNFSHAVTTASSDLTGCCDRLHPGCFVPVEIKRAGSFSLEGHADIRKITGEDTTPCL